jgi:hypothetical protein
MGVKNYYLLHYKEILLHAWAWNLLRNVYTQPEEVDNNQIIDEETEMNKVT